MLNAALLIARKDLRLIAAGGAGLLQALLLGLLLIFVFSLARQPGELIPPQTAATVFWLASAFCLVLIGNMCHGLEEAGGVRLGLLLAPMPVQAVWLGKALAILIVLLLAQSVFLPAGVAFLGQTVQQADWRILGCLVLIDLGLAVLGALLGALAQGRSARESLISLLLFPLILPVLLAGIRLGDHVFGSPDALAPDWDWFGLIAAFDALFVAAGLTLFPFVYTGEE
ncbi:MAG: heme exporter protein CcmB [Deltaproteobacteria bacterium]|jgi:heme exporter protein B|nr:heme exporter protein CcmB [Deltaproteobacteria bacterium]